MSAVLAMTAPAAAEPAVADLDGVQLWLGPAGAATHTDGAWDSSWGGSIAVLRVRERRSLAVAGGSVGAVHYAGRDGGRLWLDAVVGTRRVGGWMLGLAAGPALEVGADHHPRPGASIAAWGFAGITPVARVGVVAETGWFIEVGASLTLPALRW